MPTGVQAPDGSLRVVTTDGAGNNLGSGVAPSVSGGEYNSTKPTLSNGQTDALQLGTRGSLGVTVYAADSTNNVNVTTAGGDAASNTRNNFCVENFADVFNGSTWDRQRSIINATNSTGTGIAAAGIMAQLDDTSPTAITENQFGNLRMSPERALNVTLDSRKNVFSVGLNNNTPAATPTDFFSMFGHATRIVRIHRIKIVATATAYGTMRSFFYRYTTPPSGGTATTLSGAQFDTTLAAGHGATLNIYTANPTIASGLTTIAQPILQFSNATAGPQLPWEWRAEEHGGPIILRGTSQGIVFNLGGNAVPAGGLIHLENIMWTEE